MARDGFAQAFEIAREIGVGYVGTDMLLLGLIRAGGIAAEVLAEAGATEASIGPIVTGIGARAYGTAEPSSTEEPRLTPAAQQALGRAEGFRTALDIRTASIPMLLALAYDRDGIHSSTLRLAGVHRRRIVEAIVKRGMPVPPTPPAPDRAPHSDEIVLPDEQARVVAAELAKRSVADRDFWFDAWGGASWGYGGVPERPELARISGEPRIKLRELVLEILTAKGYPAPPDDAWQTQQEL